MILEIFRISYKIPESGTPKNPILEEGEKMEILEDGDREFFDRLQCDRRQVSWCLAQKSCLLNFLAEHGKFGKLIPISEQSLRFPPESRITFPDISKTLGTIFVRPVSPFPGLLILTFFRKK